MTTREEVIAAAKECCDLYTDKNGRDSYEFDEHGLERFYVSGAASRDAEIAELKHLRNKDTQRLANGSTKVLKLEQEHDQLRAELALMTIDRDEWKEAHDVVLRNSGLSDEQHNKDMEGYAAAIAACKAKDDLLTVLVRQYSDPIKSEYEKVLAIQPDDTALKAWIGEPVAWQSINNPLFVTSDKKVADGWQSSGYSIRNLYSPKELK